MCLCLLGIALALLVQPSTAWVLGHIFSKVFGFQESLVAAAQDFARGVPGLKDSILAHLRVARRRKQIALWLFQAKRHPLHAGVARRAWAAQEDNSGQDLLLARQQLQFALETAQAQVETAQAQVETAQAQVETAQAQVATAQEQVAIAQEQEAMAVRRLARAEESGDAKKVQAAERKVERAKKEVKEAKASGRTKESLPPFWDSDRCVRF
ncbi:unnamed protein product [Effrenium voratum]|nr:unnamed protein product [Effrenium voratum]